MRQTRRRRKRPYELGRVWLKTGRTYLMAGNVEAARAVLAECHRGLTGNVIVAQQSEEQYVALNPMPWNLAVSGNAMTKSTTTTPAKLYVTVANPSAQTRTVHFVATRSAGALAALLVLHAIKVCEPYRRPRSRSHPVKSAAR